MQSIRIGDKTINYKNHPFIIAEAGINHNGDLERAIQLVRAAAEAGADAIKFQTHFPNMEMLKDSDSAEYIGGSFYDLLDSTKLSKEDHVKLQKLAQNLGIVFLSTPFSREAADFLESINVPAFKVGSGELTNIPLVTHIAEKNKPMVISTGMSEVEEIDETLKAIRQINDQIILMQCTSTYPTEYRNVNLGVISMLRTRFQVPVGLSDHSVGIYTALGAVALGVCAIEKHFTISREWPGPDQKASIEPDELAHLVKGAKAIWEAMGETKKIIEDEHPVIAMARESVVSLVDIPKGAVIKPDMVWVKRPGTGIPAKRLYEVIGKKAKQGIKADSLILWEDLE